MGFVTFCGLRIAVDPGVYVPRPFTEALARRAASLLPSDGVAVDLCTGSGAVAAVLGSTEPGATLLATDVDPLAVACARRNGVDARLGDLDAPLPGELRGRVDVLTAVTPYVPTDELRLLPRDVVAFEPRAALDGGVDGTMVQDRVVREAPAWLRRGGHALLELGGDQASSMAAAMDDAGFAEIRIHQDEDGDDRWIEGSCTEARQVGD
jgi:release factor glutamine methyltransferase